MPEAAVEIVMPFEESWRGRLSIEELRALQWSDVNLDAGIVCVRRAGGECWIALERQAWGWLSMWRALCDGEGCVFE